MEFIVLTLVSIIVVILVVRFSLKARKPNPLNGPGNILVLAVAEILCMLIGKYGAGWGWPWWIYYSVPMLITVFFPPLYFKMRKRETVTYLVLAFLSAPLIHVLFSLAGWKSFMPFIKIPSISEWMR